MAHKTIGEGSLVDGWFEFHDSIKKFDKIDEMIKWYRLEKLMKGMYSSKMIFLFIRQIYQYLEN